MQHEAVWRMQFRTYSAWDELPAGYDALVRPGRRAGFLPRPGLVRGARRHHARRQGAPRPRRHGGRRPSRPPAWSAATASMIGRSSARAASPVSATTTPCAMLRSWPASDGRAALPALIEGLRARRPRYAVLHLEPLAADAPLSDDLARALRAAGLVTRRYATLRQLAR